MIHERKCLKCGTWNKAEKFCVNCGNALDEEEIRKQEDEEHRLAEQARPKDRFDQFMSKLKNHRFLVVRIFYRFIYGVSIIVGLFGAMMAWMAALANA